MQREDQRISIRTINEKDVPLIEGLLRTEDTFRPEEKKVGVEVLRDSVLKSSPETYLSLVAQVGESVKGWVSFGLIPCTIASWDIYWIVVSKSHQRQGIGTLLLAEAERIMKAYEARLAIIETSSTGLYAPARYLYEKMGYRKVASVPNCYAPGDHKLIYMKIFEK